LRTAVRFAAERGSTSASLTDILAALLLDDRPSADRLFSLLQVDPAAVQEGLRAPALRHRPVRFVKRAHFSTESLGALDFAMEEAGNRKVSTGHLLLGVLRQFSLGGAGSDIAQALGLDPEGILIASLRERMIAEPPEE